MSLNDNVTGVRISRTTLSRLKTIFPKYCKHGESMDTLVIRMCKVCELLDEEQIKSILSTAHGYARVRKVSPASTN
jgi:hypothetical protein